MIRRSGGFTLIEMIAILVLMGVVLAVSVPPMTGILDNSRLRTATGRAEEIYSSQQRFKARVQNAPQEWASAGPSELEYLKLLQPFGYDIHTLTDAQLRAFLEVGSYKIEILDSLDQKPRIRKDGEIIPY